MNLYEIAENILLAEERLEDAPEGSNEQRIFIEYLDSLKGEVAEKIEICVKWEKNLMATEEALAAEIARLQARKKACENQRKNIRGYIMSGLARMGMSKMKLDIATVSIRKGKPSLEVDEALVEGWPVEVFEKAVTVQYRVSKTALKDIPNHESLPGVHLVQGQDVLTIR